MRYLCVTTSLLLLFANAANAVLETFLPRVGTVAEVTAISPTLNGWAAVVTDGADLEDCSTGSGSSIHWCVWNGASWVAAADINTDSGGDVDGPSSAADNAIAIFDGTTGKLLQDQAVYIDDGGDIGLGVTNPLAHIHIEKNDSGITNPNAAADDLVIEHSGIAGMSILSGNSGAGNIYFGAPQDELSALITWDAANDRFAVAAATTSGELRLGSGASATARVTVESNGNVIFSDAIELTPTDSPVSCGSGNEGAIYADDSLNMPCYCDGTNWVQMDDFSTTC